MAEQCTARAKSTGSRCQRPVVAGTNVCRYHGGANPKVKAAGARRVAEAKAAVQVAKLGARRDIHPAEALLELVHWTAGEVDYWRTQVVEIDDDALTWGTTKHEHGYGPEGKIDKTSDEAKPHIAYAMLERSSDRLATYAAAALKAGVDERRVRLAEQQGSLVAEVIRRILSELKLSPDQEALVGEVVPRELRALVGGVA